MVTLVAGHRDLSVYTQRYTLPTLVIMSEMIREVKLVYFLLLGLHWPCWMVMDDTRWLYGLYMVMAVCHGPTIRDDPASHP
jgi:hypothetical protein